MNERNFRFTRRGDEVSVTAVRSAAANADGLTVSVVEDPKGLAIRRTDSGSARVLKIGIPRSPGSPVSLWTVCVLDGNDPNSLVVLFSATLQDPLPGSRDDLEGLIKDASRTAVERTERPGDTSRNDVANAIAEIELASLDDFAQSVHFASLEQSSTVHTVRGEITTLSRWGRHTSNVRVSAGIDVAIQRMLVQSQVMQLDAVHQLLQATKDQHELLEAARREQREAMAQAEESRRATAEQAEESRRTRAERAERISLVFLVPVGVASIAAAVIGRSFVTVAVLAMITVAIAAIAVFVMAQEDIREPGRNWATVAFQVLLVAFSLILVSVVISALWRTSAR